MMKRIWIQWTRRAAQRTLWLSVLLPVPSAMAAGAWDNFVNSATSSVLDATRNTLNNALQSGQSGTSQAEQNTPAQSGQNLPQQSGQITPAAPKQPSQSAQTSQPRQGDPSVSGSVPCIEEQRLSPRVGLITNTCPYVIRVITMAPTTGGCAQVPRAPGGQEQMPSPMKVIATCRHDGSKASHDCQCPPGTQL